MEEFKRFSKKQNIEQKELSDLTRTVTEVEYLLLLLVILYIVVPGTTIADRSFVVFISVGCGILVIFFNYALRNMMNRNKLAVQSLIMTIFVTVVLWFTGKSESHLINLYSIIIIYSALTLGRVTTLLLVGLITSCILYFDYSEYALSVFSQQNANVLMGQLVTLYSMLLVSYLTIMVASHMQLTRNKIKRLSEQDELTGLLNMRAFSVILNRECKQSERYKRKFTIIMVDVDNLKAINDKYGHMYGDEFIRLVSAALQDSLRTTDVAARYGGDEFIILLPETGTQGALGCAERMRRKVEATRLSFDRDGQNKLSISIGVANFPENARDPEILVNSADQALYMSKNKGKNQITLAQQDSYAAEPVA